LQAIILAGGKGTRLGALTQEIPKPMIEIAGQPILAHQVLLCKRYGITQFIFIVNHLHESIAAYFGNGEKWGVTIDYYIEEMPLGTVGGIKAIESKLTETFIVLYGDVMVNMDLHRLLAFHRSKNSDATLVLHPNDHPYDSDLVEMNQEDRITAFHSKPHDDSKYYRNLVNAGVYVFEPIVLSYLEQGVKADFGKDIFPTLVDQLVFNGYNTTEYLKDMGTPDRLQKVTADYVSGKIERCNFEHARGAIFFDRDGVLNEEVSFIEHPDQLMLIPGATEAIQKVNASEYISVVVTNQSAVARNMVTEEGLREIHNKLETLLGQAHAKIDDIYYCPHHPHKGFEGENAALKIDCDCRKPKSGMLLQAQEKYHIDFKKSWMIGDTERDILAGKNVGCTTIGVHTGMGVRHTHTKPDYMFADVLEAVNFIIDEPLLPIFNQVYERFQAHEGDQPFVINIGGNTRSGKSTLATYLHKKFEAHEIRTMKVELDNWIIANPDRAASKDVFDRFDMLTLIKDLTALMRGAKIEKEGHMHHPETSSNGESYQIKSQKVIIIGGVVALSYPQLRGLSNYKIYKAISQDKLKEKFTSFYRWKGYSIEEIENIYAKRQIDEYDLIEYDQQFAHLVV
jgi:histidinol-phosphate phosphatase family protein